MNSLLNRAGHDRNRLQLEISVASAIYAMTHAQFVRIHTLLQADGEQLTIVSTQVDATGVYSTSDTQDHDWGAAAELLGEHPLMNRVVSSQAPVRKREGTTGLHHCFYPITLHGEVRGIVELKENHRPYQDEDALISSFISLFINYTHFLDSSQLDPLTGLLKQDYLEPRLREILAAPLETKGKHLLVNERTGCGYCLARVAVDHFEEINSLYGHLFGDEMLRRIARELAQRFEPPAQVYVLGREEFIVLLPTTATRLIEPDFVSLIEHVATLEFPNIGQVTLSVGLSQLFPQDEPQQILERAGLALSKAQSQNTKITPRPGAR